jgi:molecular chaperone GrpE (heat shock protein)
MSLDPLGSGAEDRPAERAAPDPGRKAEILAAVSAWLDEHADEPLPAGIDPDLVDDTSPAADLGAMVAAVLACRHEVKLQTKAFRRVEERLGAALDELAAVREAATRASGAQAEALVELFDRLRRCAGACTEAGVGLPWFGARAAAERRLAGLGEGLALTLARARELLAERGFATVEPTAEPFDALRMRAVGRAEPTPAIRAGCVLETVRAGIERDGTVVRPAEVVVARDVDPGLGAG